MPSQPARAEGTRLELREFDALTFDCYGTLIDWEPGILEALRPWAERHHLEVSNDELLVAFAEFESRHEAATPQELYSRILETVFRDIAAHYGVEPAPEGARTFAASYPALVHRAASSLSLPSDAASR